MSCESVISEGAIFLLYFDAVVFELVIFLLVKFLASEEGSSASEEGVYNGSDGGA